MSRAGRNVRNAQLAVNDRQKKTGIKPVFLGILNQAMITLL